MRTCTGCATSKPATKEFFPSYRGGLDSRCRTCKKQYHADWVAKNKERLRAKDRAYYLGKHPEKKADAMRRYYLNPEEAKRKNWERRLQKVYGLTLARYEEMLREQGGLCGLCARVSPSRLDVDHDHETGVIRRLLCRSCNLGLGVFRSDPELLRKAAAYIQEHRTVVVPIRKGVS